MVIEPSSPQKKTSSAYSVAQVGHFRLTVRVCYRTRRDAAMKETTADRRKSTMKANLLQRAGDRFAHFFRKTTPDPMVLAILLTGLTFGLAWLSQDAGPAQIIAAWQGDAGFFSLLAFSMQMVLILVTGHALACSPIAEKLIRRVSSLARSPRAAVALVSATAMLCGLLNWGLGLIVGAMLARDMGRSLGRRNIPHNYPLLAAAGYTGMLCWHGGLSGSAPLKMTLEADVRKFLGTELAARVGTLPFTESVLAAPNLIITGGLLILVPLLLFYLHPRRDEASETEQRRATGTAVMRQRDREPLCYQHDAFESSDRRRTMNTANRALAEEPKVEPEESWLQRLDESRVLAWCVIAALGAGVWNFLAMRGISQLDPNALNLIFLTLGLAAHGNLRAYAKAVADGVRGTTGIVLQFPFYAGIMGVMRGTGLAASIATSFTQSVPASLFPLATFGSAALVNMFVPSGGGQWAIQAPIAMQGAVDLDLSSALTMMSVAYGDQLTNMLQPFWALPLLAITGAKAKDIIGYTALVMLFAALWIGAWLVYFASAGW